MKTILILLISVICSLQLSAQTLPANGSKTPIRVKLEDMEVKDSSGIVYPPIIWQKLLASGMYGVRLLPDRKTALISKLSEEEMTERLTKLPKPRESNFFKTGATIASFKESDMNGNKYSLKELTGKVVVLNFWFINCPPCRQEMPELNEMVESFKNNKDVVFIAVALDQKYEIKEFLKTNPFIYNIIYDGLYISQKYNVTSYPTHVVLDKQGKVVFHTSGLALNTVPWVKKSIDAALTETATQ